MENKDLILTKDETEEMVDVASNTLAYATIENKDQQLTRDEVEAVALDTIASITMENEAAEAEEEYPVFTETDLAVTQQNNEIIPGIGKATAFFQAREAIRNFKSSREEIAETRKSITDKDGADISDILIERAGNLSSEDIRKISDEHLDKIYEDIEVNLDMSNKDKGDFRRDFLLYVIESEKMLKSIDAELLKFEEHIAHSEDELEELFGGFNNINDYIKKSIDERLLTAEGADRERLLLIKSTYEEIYKLDKIYDHYAALDLYNTISELKSDSRALTVYGRYKKSMTKLGIRTDLTNFNNFEKRFLPEKYHAMNNMLLFSIIKYYGFKKDLNRITDGIFLAELAVVLKSLYSNTLSEQERTDFTNAAMRLLDLFLK